MTDARKQIVVALTHIVGALVVRLEDKQAVDLKPWTRLAADASAHIKETAWPLRSLLFALVDRPQCDDQPREVVKAPRALLRYALDTAATPLHLVTAAIEFVA